MTSINVRGEIVRVLGLLVAIVVLEVLVLSEIMFRLLAAVTQWPVFPQLLISVVPRLVAMAVLVGVLGRFRSRWAFLIFLVAYSGLLLVRFDQSEVFVDWGSTIGASRATLPYVGGLIGVVLGFWIGRVSAISRATAVEKS